MKRLRFFLFETVLLSLFLFTVLPITAQSAKSTKVISLEQNKVLPKPPTPIVIPKAEKSSGSLFKKFGVKRKKWLDDAFISILEGLTKNIGPLHFSKIPFIKLLPIPKNVRSFFDKLVIKTPKVVSDGAGGFAVSGGVDVFGSNVDAHIIVKRDSKEKTSYAVMVHMPSKFRFSKLFPKTKLFNPGILDFFEFSTIWIGLATKDMGVAVVDRDLVAVQEGESSEHELKAGLNLFGRVKIAGPVFNKLDKVFGGRLKDIGTLAIHGVIGLNTRLIGTMLKFQVTDGIKITNWLGTTPLRFIVAVEEKATQVPAPSISIQGGLKFLLPLQKKPIALQLTGKYFFPKDIELYADMIGWLKDVPIPGVSIGNLRVGLGLDVALIVETAGPLGWVSGINLAASVGFGESKLGIAIKGAISGDTVIGDLTFILHGSVRLRDVAWIGGRYYDLFSRTVGGGSVRSKVLANIPDIELQDVRIAFVPRKTREYKKNIELTVGKINLFGLLGSGSLFISEAGLQGFIQLPEIVIGKKKKPILKITGAGIGKQKGPVLDVRINLGEQSIFGEGIIESSLFGMRQAGRIDISKSGLEAAADFMFMGLFGAEFHAKASLTRGKVKPENLLVRVALKQPGLDKLSKFMLKASKELLGDLSGKIKKIKEKALHGFKEKMERAQAKTIEKITKIKESVKNKKNACNKKYSGLMKGMRPACYVWKGIPKETLKLLALYTHRDVTLRVVTTGGKVSIVSTAALGQVTSKAIPARSIGKVMNFLSKIINKTINIRHFEIEASSDKLLSRGQAFNLKKFSANILGKDIELKDIKFDLKRMKDFLLMLYDITKKSIKKGLKISDLAELSPYFKA